ncbi:MAG: hypothetical protein FWE30_06400, partial [Bacteroidales bacterium]|nr:hypothetical protein [Bacteroidales bacterium]
TSFTLANSICNSRFCSFCLRTVSVQTLSLVRILVVYGKTGKMTCGFLKNFDVRLLQTNTPIAKVAGSMVREEGKKAAAEGFKG